mgnify:CR=1
MRKVRTRVPRNILAVIVSGAAMPYSAVWIQMFSLRIFFMINLSNWDNGKK